MESYRAKDDRDRPRQTQNKNLQSERGLQHTSFLYNIGLEKEKEKGIFDSEFLLKKDK